MSTQMELRTGPMIFAEIEEFGSFAAETQQYIRRSLEVAFARHLDGYRWARDEDEALAISTQRRIYRALPEIRAAMPGEVDQVSAESFLFPLIALSVFDLGSGRLTSFAPYRFLYERLLGAEVRRWLPSAFAVFAALPHPDLHHRFGLLASLGRAVTDRWSAAQPAFFPKWLEV